MAEIQPFQGVRYDTPRVKPDDVLTQPYDKITPALREQYLNRSPYNLVRIELGPEQSGDSATSNKYTRARDLYREWRRQGILRRSARPALYYLEQEFLAPAGSPGTVTRQALIARVRLHRWDEGQILPHEHTLSKPKADRLSLLRACGAQQGQIFMLYPGSQQPIRKLVASALGNPVLQTHQDPRPPRRPEQSPEPTHRGRLDESAVKNTLWEISEPAAIRAVQDALGDLKFYIADGHHRYETALAFRDECRAAAAPPDPDAPAEFVMATLVDMNDPGLFILPTHRTVAHLAGFDQPRFRQQLTAAFALEPQPTLEALLGAMRGDGNSAAPAIGMADPSGFTLLRLRDAAALRPLFENKPALWHQLDVAILHVAILEPFLGIDETRLREEANVTYWREPEQAADQVRQGGAQLAFFLNPTRVADVQAIADARSRMPQKSTDFYPKLLSGLVMYEVDPGPVAAE